MKKNPGLLPAHRIDFQSAGDEQRALPPRITLCHQQIYHSTAFFSFFNGTAFPLLQGGKQSYRSRHFPFENNGKEHLWP
jgi:hypothetical protein